jgi:hypothetical protein
MLVISVPVGDRPTLDTTGTTVRINGHTTALRRVGEYLHYDDEDGNQNRCRILDEFEDDNMIHLSAASHGEEESPHVIVRPSSAPFVPTREDIYQLAHRHFDLFLSTDFGCNFMMAMFENSQGPWDNYCRASQHLDAEYIQRLLDYFDNRMDRDHGEHWQAYKYRFPDRGFRPAALDRVVRLARSIPESQWGQVIDHGYSIDLHDALRMAVEEKATNKKTDWKESGF